jgi:aminoglycoside 2'-N-acetyltransferase I
MPLSIELVESGAAPRAVHQEILDLCSAAYATEFSEVMTLIGTGVHLLGRLGPRLVAHAMWVTRWLQPGGRTPLRTAYVEAVATHPEFQRRGFASELLLRLAREIRDHELGALSPSDEVFYARLGWERWQGSLFIRTLDGLTATPDEEVMILRLPGTPRELEVQESLSAEWREGELW